MVISTLRLFPSQEQRRDVLAALRSVQGPTRSLSHCLCCELLEEDGFEDAILYMQQWDSEEELHLHIQSDLYGRILGIAELSRIPPEFNFHYVKKSRQLDLIEALRCHTSHKNCKL
jgi:quinol monooxygenase YgiN